MKSLSSLVLAIIAVFLSLPIVATPIADLSANAAATVHSRQNTRQNVVARASRTRPKRQATSPVPCNPATGGAFRIQYSSPATPPTFLTAGPDSYYYPGAASAATRFTMDSSGRLLWAGTTFFAANSRTDGASYITTTTASFLVPIVCTLSPTLGITCTVQGTARNFYTCPNFSRGALLFATAPLETACVLQSLSVVPACLG